MKFLTVILGADTNAYGIAKSIYQYFGETSICLSTMPLFMTANSKFITQRFNENIHNDEDLVSELIKIAEETPELNHKRIIFAASDNYAISLINNQDKLKKYYHLPVIKKEQLEQFELKEKFYNLCEKTGMPYAKTQIVTKDTYKDLNINLSLPLVLKPSNSVSYFDFDFDGKRKAFILNNYDEVKDILHTIYKQGYLDNMILQEFIPGDDSHMRVLNAYVDQNSKVQAMSLGHPLLEDVTPELIGNYVAIISENEQKLYDISKQFLEQIKFTGIADIDFKYDARDDEYKIFEVNLRLGRSSYYTTLAESDLIKQIIKDLIFNEAPSSVLINKKQALWLGVPKKVALRYIKNEKLKTEAKNLIDKNEYGFTLFFDEDNKKRNKQAEKYYNSYKKRYKQYFIEKETK